MDEWHPTYPFFMRLGFKETFDKNIKTGYIDDEINKYINISNMFVFFSSENSIVVQLHEHKRYNFLKRIYNLDNFEFVKLCKENHIDYRILIKSIDNPR